MNSNMIAAVAAPQRNLNSFGAHVPFYAAVHQIPLRNPRPACHFESLFQEETTFCAARQALFSHIQYATAVKRSHTSFNVRPNQNWVATDPLLAPIGLASTVRITKEAVGGNL